MRIRRAVVLIAATAVGFSAVQGRAATSRSQIAREGTVRNVKTSYTCDNPDPNWIFCEDFESSSWADSWGEIAYPDRMTRDTTYQHGGAASLRYSYPVGDQVGAGWMHHWWTPADSQSAVYVRWWTRFDTDFDWGTGDVKIMSLMGLMPDQFWQIECQVPNGTWYDVKVKAYGVGPDSDRGPRQPLQYRYDMTIRGPCGKDAVPNSHISISNGEWNCFELMVTPNTVGIDDGQTSLWVNDSLQRTVTGIRFRDTDSAKIKDLFPTAWIGGPTHTSTQYRWDDDIVVSTSRIYCN